MATTWSGSRSRRASRAMRREILLLHLKVRDFFNISWLDLGGKRVGDPNLPNLAELEAGGR